MIEYLKKIKNNMNSKNTICYEDNKHFVRESQNGHNYSFIIKHVENHREFANTQHKALWSNATIHVPDPNAPIIYIYFSQAEHEAEKILNQIPNIMLNKNILEYHFNVAKDRDLVLKWLKERSSYKFEECIGGIDFIK